MKKLVSIMLIAVILMSAMSVSAFAEVPPEDKFYDRFVEKYGDAMYYQEVQPHYDENNEIDWVVVCAYTEMAVVDVLPDADHYNCYENGEFVFHEKDLYAPFTTQHCVYDPKKDEFIDITKVNFDEYKDLKKHVRTYYFANLIGDVDDDNDVTILDATEIQLILAKLKEQYVGICVSDFDRDGGLTVLDATAIQLKLAGLVPEEPYNEEMVYSDFNNMYGVDTGIENVYFETLYNGDQNYAENKIHSERFAVIIKSQEQFESVFYSDYGVEDYLSDEFFNDRWIVASACRVTDAEMVAEITDLGVRGNTLFIRADKMLCDSDGVAEPLAPMYHSFVAVDKDALAQVTEIIWL
ncbi:MAG: hypothetical protein IJ331_05780 [Ruminococcus sp.]|nr:hypothetical protein [Ruminococcus sp.]